MRGWDLRATIEGATAVIEGDSTRLTRVGATDCDGDDDAVEALRLWTGTYRPVGELEDVEAEDVVRWILMGLDIDNDTNKRRRIRGRIKYLSENPLQRCLA